eukprot:1732342-Amphidinium_carterae.2
MNDSMSHRISTVWAAQIHFHDCLPYVERLSGVAFTAAGKIVVADVHGRHGPDWAENLVSGLGRFADGRFRGQMKSQVTPKTTLGTFGNKRRKLEIRSKVHFYDKSPSPVMKTFTKQACGGAC